MKPCWAAGLLSAFIWAATANVPAQEQAIKKSVYEKLEIVYGEVEGNLNGFFHRFSKGVHMKFMKLFDKASEDDLDVQSETVEFTYIDDEDKIPDVIVFEGDVQFAHQSGTVRAEKATVDLQTNEVLLTGNITYDLPPVRGGEAEWIRINLDTGKVTAGPGKLREIDLRGGENAPGSGNSAGRNSRDYYDGL